jgi:hypothetical protein
MHNNRRLCLMANRMRFFESEFVKMLSETTKYLRFVRWSRIISGRLAFDNLTRRVIKEGGNFEKIFLSTVLT